ncbi:FtsX-like permease family protein [Ornithinibacillus halotolerans]|uniref:ABC transporter permease n=1 Tax=Ornithinibacillus halotolerans TaxID=1274357 RepID=A0A916WEI6_9BACI|nr:FtsX-like permease family protein [Ornithinibacillus halotolerans]GGA91034.1 ABC transporter permease [Ornithinibacillus halotolerans]
MIKSVKQLAGRFLRENKFIVVSSIIGVMLSIVIINTLLMFIIDGKQLLVEDVQQQYGEMDVSVGYDAYQDHYIDSELMEEIVSNEVEAYSKVWITPLHLDEMGEEILALGVENDSLAKGRYHFQTDLKSEDVIMPERLAANLGIQLGDTITVESKAFTVKEILRDNSMLEEIQQDYIIMPRSSIQELDGQRTNEATTILIKLQPGSDLLAYINKFRQLDPMLTMEVAQADSFEEVNLNLLNQFIIVLSLLILVITSLILISNFDIFLYKYKNQLAILRSMGATRGQVFHIILLQTIVINVIGAGLGLLFTFVSYRLLKSWMEYLFSISVADAGVNIGIAFVVTISCMTIIQLFMLYPSIKSTKILPMVVMQDNEKLDIPYRNVIKWTGLISIIGGGLFLLIGALSSNLALFILLGVFLFLIGFYCLFPIYLSKVFELIAPIINRIFGRVSYLSVKNLIPQVRKNMFIILGISLMMTISVFGSTVMKSIHMNQQSYIQDQHRADIIIKNEVGINANLDRELLRDEIGKINEVKSISMQSTYSEAMLRKDNQSIPLDYAFADLKELIEQGLVEPFEWDKNVIIIEEQFAAMNGIKIGDTLEIQMWNLDNESFSGDVTVASIAENMPDWGSMLIDWNNTVFEFSNATFGIAFVQTDHIEQTMEQLEAVEQKYPELSISNLNQALEQADKMFIQRWYILIIVLFIIMFSVLLGVVNTLINTIHMKRKEFAVLRAVSLTKKELRKFILTQVFLYISMGMVSGFIIGVILVYAIRLIDPVPMYVDVLLLISIILISIIVILSVLVPFINRIGKYPLLQELTEENK